MKNLASRRDAWLAVFGVFKYLATGWAFYIMYKRVNLFEASKKAKSIAFIFASLLIIFYLSLGFIRTYAMQVYGKASHGHHGHHGHHSSGKMFQSVEPSQAILLQKGATKGSCSECGMNLPKFYKTNHAATTAQGETKQYCSINCMATHKAKETTTQERVVDVRSLTFIDAHKAYYVLGSKKKGTMAMVSKYAFANKADAQKFIKMNGGKLVTFDEALLHAKSTAR